MKLNRFGFREQRPRRALADGEHGNRRWILLLIAVGVLGWATLWLAIRPHASWDALFYHRFAAEYAGLPVALQDDYAWQSSVEYFDPAYRGWLEENHSWPWAGWDNPDRERWVGEYRMRPLYPALVAIGYPVFGTDSPVVITLLATLVFVLAVGSGLARLAGRQVALLSLGLLLITPGLSQWLVFLQTDGIALALFAAGLVQAGLYASSGRRYLLILLAITVGLLALARPLAFVLPPAIGLSAVVSALRRDPVWRRFVYAASVATAPVIGFVIVAQLAGFPSFNDLMQDLPTVHFSLPDVPDPWRYIFETVRRQVRDNLIPALVSNPLVLALPPASVAGYLLARPGWWALPMVLTVPLVMLTYVVHPSLTEVVRTLAPAWLAIHLGLALLIGVGLQRVSQTGRLPAL